MPKTSVREKVCRIFKTNLLAQLVSRYFTDGVGIRGAALAYYLLFSVFPLAILFSSILSMLHINLNTVTDTLRSILPTSIVSLITSYLFYIEIDYNTSIMTFSLVFSVYFPWRAVRGLMYDIRFAFRQSPDQKPRLFFFRELFCTLIIPGFFTAAIAFIVVGRNVIQWVVRLLPPDTIHLSSLVLNIWEYARFALAGVVVTIALTIVYQMSLNHPVSFRRLFPGTMIAVIVWLVTSVIFTIYVEKFGNYSVIYGTLGAVIVLLLWLYLSGIVFIMGAELNAILLQRALKRKEEKEQV